MWPWPIDLRKHRGLAVSTIDFSKTEQGNQLKVTNCVRHNASNKSQEFRAIDTGNTWCCNAINVDRYTQHLQRNLFAYFL